MVVDLNVVNVYDLWKVRHFIDAMHAITTYALRALLEEMEEIKKI